MIEANIDPGKLVQDDRVHTSLYTSDEIFDLEMDLIYKKTWVWVAHESEIPLNGNFRRSFVGRQPVIVTRDREGVVHVLLNRCRHRALRISASSSATLSEPARSSPSRSIGIA